jgi:hypothetical protein
MYEKIRLSPPTSYKLLITNWGGDVGPTCEIIAEYLKSANVDGIVLSNPYVGRDTWIPFLKRGIEVFIRNEPTGFHIEDGTLLEDHIYTLAKSISS